MLNQDDHGEGEFKYNVQLPMNDIYMYHSRPFIIKILDMNSKKTPFIPK